MSVCHADYAQLQKTKRQPKKQHSKKERKKRFLVSRELYRILVHDECLDATLSGLEHLVDVHLSSFDDVHDRCPASIATSTVSGRLVHASEGCNLPLCVGGEFGRPARRSAGEKNQVPGMRPVYRGVHTLVENRALPHHRLRHRFFTTVFCSRTPSKPDIMAMHMLARRSGMAPRSAPQRAASGMSASSTGLLAARMSQPWAVTSRACAPLAPRRFYAAEPKVVRVTRWCWTATNCRPVARCKCVMR
jgi:hypothetical protein